MDVLSHTYPSFQASLKVAAGKRLEELQAQFTSAVLAPRFRTFLHNWRMRHPRYRYANTITSTIGSSIRRAETKAEGIVMGAFSGVSSSIHHAISPGRPAGRKVAAGD